LNFQRTAAQLKKCWENAKARRRKAEAMAHQKAVEARAESTVESSDREVDLSLLLPYFRQQVSYRRSPSYKSHLMYPLTTNQPHHMYVFSLSGEWQL